MSRELSMFMTELMNSSKDIYLLELLINEKFRHGCDHRTVPHFLRFSVLSLTRTSCDLKELKGLWTSMISCDLNALCEGDVVRKFRYLRWCPLNRECSFNMRSA